MNVAAVGRSARLLAFDQRTELHAQHAGQFRQHQQTDVELTAFEAGDERAVQVGSQCQCFLTKALRPRCLADTCADGAQ
jgi:hypothetical protein